MNLIEKIKSKKNANTEAQKTSRISLEKEIYAVGSLPNFASGAIAIIYILISTKLQPEHILPFIITAILTTVILQGLVAPITNRLITQNLSDDLDSFYNYESDTKERTKLLKQLMSCPGKIGLEVFVVFAIGGLIWISSCNAICHFKTHSMIMFAVGIFMGAYTGAILGIIQTQKVCSKHAARIVKAGVLKEEVDEKHCFGITSTVLVVLHIFGPVLIINVIFMIYAWRSNKFYFAANDTLIRLFVMTIFNVVYYIVFLDLIFRRMMKSIHLMKDILENMDRDNFQDATLKDTDLSNEFMYNVYLINTIIHLLQTILRQSSEISMEVIESSNELSVISKETAVTSLEQSSGIKELLTAMEESDALSKNIAEKISEVSLVARRTTDDINDGFDILNQNMQKLDEIKQANEITVDGIKILSEKISGISDIAGIINSIADQTNIIAFNAELEASRAGQAGENFKMVANEIRRLTNNTIQSTNEIRTRIIEIQHSSENLLASSQSGSKKIKAGNDIINELHDSFEDLKLSSQTTDSASEEIKNIIEQQTASFEQIVTTLRQIAQAAESFSVSTQDISQSAENLCTISDELKKLQQKNNSAIVG